MAPPHSPPSPTQSDYQSAIEFYAKVSEEYTRKEAEDIGGRSFVLVQAVTDKLLENNDNGEYEYGQLSRLLQAVYRRNQYQTPQQDMSQLLDYLPIFYTLLDLEHGHEVHRFFENQIKQLPIGLEDLETTLFPPSRYKDLSSRFYDRQWRWCAMQFEWKMGHKNRYAQEIVPITQRSKIEPARDGLPKTDGKATLWNVEVPEGFVGKQLQSKLKASEEDMSQTSSANSETAHKSQKTASKHYRLVIKQFGEDRKDEFKREKNIYSRIGEKDGIVKCIGWYMHRESDPTANQSRNYYNLVLELGDQDLYRAFQRENPPITSMEIEAFWTSLFAVADALASIQTIDSDRFVSTHVWHGDIKPENILDVRGHFKLADPGEASALPMRKGTSTVVPKLRVPGGTRTFAAPETLRLHNPDSTEPGISQGSDVWSLGCVFSVAATYVVLGKEGVKQYRLLRQEANEGTEDSFHDKEKVLTKVTDWHKYLKANVRKGDLFTEKVLDLLDSDVLIVPEETRLTGAVMSTRLNSLAAEAHPAAINFPMDIAAFIDKVAGKSEGGQSQLDDVPRTTPQSGAELFTETLLYPSRRSEGRPFTKSPPPDDTFRGIGLGLDPRRSDSIPRRVSGFFSDSERERARPSQLPYLATGHHDEPNGMYQWPERMVPEVPPVTFWEVESDLLRYKGRKSIFKQRMSVYGKKLQGKEDLLEHHFDNRDLVYLVDNASTMASFWRHASYLLRVLVERSLGYDKNGMELRFTNGGGKWDLEPKRDQKVKHFEDRMGRADPGKANTNAKTDMGNNLECIITNHIQANRKDDASMLTRHLTILVLTDGLWDGDEYSVDEALISVVKKMHKDYWGSNTFPDTTDAAEPRPSRPRPISIQFIRFGHHADAIARLDRLDNHLKDHPDLVGLSIPDLIDTENADGDVYKMFLGSFLEEHDNKMIQGAAVPPVSIRSGPCISTPVDHAETLPSSIQPPFTWAPEWPITDGW
ncbi:hypothetical protein F4780DRAFT_798388 [Xylariomycetidae sp. FL0641]|nr:hypothetical protein F4780DRAFT_798388 [Xylariomycetidae sp. FL0641]